MQEWAAFWETEPFGCDWLQTAMLLCQAANLWGRKKGEAAFKPERFMPNFKKDMSLDDLKSSLLDMVAKQNAQFKKNKGKDGAKPVSRDKKHSARDVSKPQKPTDTSSNATRRNGTRENRRRPKA